MGKLRHRDQEHTFQEQSWGREPGDPATVWVFNWTLLLPTPKSPAHPPKVSGGPTGERPSPGLGSKQHTHTHILTCYYMHISALSRPLTSHTLVHTHTHPCRPEPVTQPGPVLTHSQLWPGDWFPVLISHHPGCRGKGAPPTPCWSIRVQLSPAATRVPSVWAALGHLQGHGRRSLCLSPPQGCTHTALFLCPESPCTPIYSGPSGPPSHPSWMFWFCFVKLNGSQELNQNEKKSITESLLTQDPC